MKVLGHLLEILHVSDEHHPQLQKVLVLQVLHLQDGSRVEAASDLLALGFNQLIGSNHRERDAALEKSSLLFEIFIFARLCIRLVIDSDVMFLDFIQNPFLQVLLLLQCACVAFLNNRHSVRLAVYCLHKRNIQRLKSVSERGNEVRAAVHPVTDDAPLFRPLSSAGAVQIAINVGDDCFKAVPAVDGVPEARCVQHGQTQLDPSLFSFNSRSLNLKSSCNFLCSSR